MRTRIKKCAETLKETGYDALLISNATNITYLTGFREADGYLLVTSDEVLFYFTNFLYQTEAEKIDAWKVIVSNGDIFMSITKKIKYLGLKKVAFEAKILPFLEYIKLRNYLSKENVDFLETLDFIEKIRIVKEAHEIMLIKESIRITQKAINFIKEIHDETMTEKDLSIETEKFLKLQADNRLAFPPVVATGQNTALPHHIPTETKLNKNFFLIDLGSMHCGYCADLTRVFFWGKISSLFKKIYDAVRLSHDSAIDKIKAGVKANEVDKAAREIIEKKGWGKYFGHGLGHGIGLAVHELPYLNRKNEEILKEGMVVTVEPAIYIKGKFGVRIENMVLVKETKGEILSGNIHW